MTDRELMQQWLRPGAIVPVDMNTVRILITALRERLAQPQRTHWEGCEEVHPECRKPEQEESEAVRAAWMAGYTEGEREVIENQPVQQQEPVAHVYLFEPNGRPRVAWDNANGIKIGDKLYTTPPQRTWVGLTDEEISDLWCKVSNTDFVTADTHVFARAIEAKLKENT